jgi:hypothetical protein
VKKVSRNGFYESTNDYGNCGMFLLPRKGASSGYYFLVMAGDSEGWEHVSISILPEQRCPTWEEMCYIKSLFWGDEDAVMQLHPAKKDWVNYAPYCLHLWRPIGQGIPLPPATMVGHSSFNKAQNNTQNG